MFYLLLAIVGLILLIIGLNDCDDLYSFLGSVSLFFCFIILSIMLIFYVPLHSNLSGQYEKIKIIEENISLVRDSYYPNNSKNTMIGGSIENIKQSTNLTGYVRDLIKEKTEYTSTRKRAFIHKKSKTLWWFGYGFFISDDIYKLPELE